MSIIDNAIQANRKYSHTHNPKLAQRPYPKIAVEIPVRGFVFDMATGLLSEVLAVAQETAA